MAEERLLNKVPVVEIHQPKKYMNSFFNGFSSVKTKIVRNPWRFKILRVSKLLGLAPSVMRESQVNVQQFTDLLDLYQDDLPSPQLFSSEFQRWKIIVQDGRIVSDSCTSSLKACDPDDFPNLYMLLKIAATFSVTTCECERYISTMRRLNNYMRCTMGESRLSALALMHIKYGMPVNLDEIVNLFEGLHPRMMQFTSLVNDYQQIE